MIGAPTGFEQFWQLYVLQYGAPILQMLLWIVQIAVFVYAVMLFKRLVDFKTGRTESDASDGASALNDAPGEVNEKVNIEEFVE